MHYPEDSDPQVSPERGTSDDVPAWEMIEAGRYQPRRVRGSFRGRALG